MPVEPPAVPTIETIARRAGVSIASVSRVLNGIGGRPATVQAVTRAARELGYVPNAVACSLQSRRTGQIAFAMADVADPVYLAMLREIEVLATAAGYRLVLHITAGDTVRELDLLRGLARRYVDGLIICPMRLSPAHLAELGRVPVPVVVVGSLPDPPPRRPDDPADRSPDARARPRAEPRVEPGVGQQAIPAPPLASVPATGPASVPLSVTELPVDAVLADARGGAALAVRHLHEAGRRRIAFVNGPPDTVSGRARQLGYAEATRACGLPGDDRLTEYCDTQRAAGAEATGRLLARADPDAIVCASDVIALGALHALREAGRTIPEDVAVVGMDDSDLARISWPALTSVALGAEERGAQAVELLLDRLGGIAADRPCRHVTVEPRLVVRESSLTAALRATQADLLQQ